MTFQDTRTTDMEFVNLPPPGVAPSATRNVGDRGLDVGVNRQGRGHPHNTRTGDGGIKTYAISAPVLRIRRFRGDRGPGTGTGRADEAKS